MSEHRIGFYMAVAIVVVFVGAMLLVVIARSNRDKDLGP